MNVGNRMKTYYEEISKTKLLRRTPVIIRIDGKAFHSFTRGFIRPFDEYLIQSMQNTTKYLCEHIQGTVLGYCQSDEISLVLIDYKTLKTSAWFDNEVQKMCSVSASMATMAFNKIFNEIVKNGHDNKKYLESLDRACRQGALFDSRVFNVPKEEVTNYIYWRQVDATRNSIQMVGRAYFSHKELFNKSCNDIQDMLMTQKGINWNDYPVYQKRGTCVIKTNDSGVNNDDNWFIDKNIPIFKGDDRNYIDKLIMVGEE